MAVGLVVLLLEAAFAQGFEAELTHKVLRVELGAHGGDAAAHNGLLARLAHAATGLVVVRLTQRLALVLEEASVHKRAETLLRGERKQVKCVYHTEQPFSTSRSSAVTPERHLVGCRGSGRKATARWLDFLLNYHNTFICLYDWHNTHCHNKHIVC